MTALEFLFLVSLAVFFIGKGWHEYRFPERVRERGVEGMRRRLGIWRVIQPTEWMERMLYPRTTLPTRIGAAMSVMMGVTILVLLALGAVLE
ncbi:MAG: hypothetical protein ACOY3Y_19795 [Acidobacteriota bacterium]